MTSNLVKKIQVSLEDYPFQQDIELRRLMAELSVFDVTLLTEIVHGSLKVRLSHLAEDLEASLSDIASSLENLKRTKLFHLENDTLLIHKEIRKYWEDQIPKFRDDFKPDIEFLKGVLSKAPIHALPNWYAIPKSSDDIFASILEKCLLTPKIYLKHLEEVQSESPLLRSILQDVFASPNYALPARTIVEKYRLTPTQFHTTMLLLEFNFACFLSYRRQGGRWEEVVTPFYEWQEYLRHQQETAPRPLSDTVQLQPRRGDHFGFVQDLAVLIQAVSETPLTLQRTDDGIYSPAPDAPIPAAGTPYGAALLTKSLCTHLVRVEGSALIATPAAPLWLQKPLTEQALFLYRALMTVSKSGTGPHQDRCLREIESSLKEHASDRWIAFHDFCKACTAPIGSQEAVALTKRGKHWKYQFPEYQQEEREVIRQHLCETLFYSGLLSLGELEGALFIKLTPFGRKVL